MLNDDTPLLERIFAGQYMKFLVLSRSDVRTAQPEVPYIVISITDPENGDAEIAPSPFLMDVLRLRFHDAKEVSVPGLEWFTLSPDIRMSDADAHAILTFVSKHRDAIELIVCHCEAGISRSSAVAAALSRIAQGEDDFFFQNYWPNKHVYHRLLKTAGQAPANR